MALQEKRYTRRFVLLAVVFAAVLLLSLQLGRYQISPWEQLRMLFTRLTGGEPFWETSTGKVLFEIRLPRIGAAVLVGAALSVSGVSYQGMFRNPMVSPDILGASTLSLIHI